METTDEWTIRTEEEELDILYEEWETWFEAESEHTTIPICLECGNALNESYGPFRFKTEPVWSHIFFCGVCE